MYAEMGIEPSALSVARHYGSLLSAYVLDQTDSAQIEPLRAIHLPALATQTLMITPGERHRLAQEVLEFAVRVMERRVPERRSSREL
jgi:LPPG:FO 2-phospho-L-lactate transferase